MVTRLSGEDGFVNDDIRARYTRFSKGGAGLVVLEAMAVHSIEERSASSHLGRRVRAGPLGSREALPRRGPRKSRSADHPLLEDLALGLATNRRHALARRTSTRSSTRTAPRPSARGGAASTASSSTWRTRTRCRRFSRASTRGATSTAARSKIDCAFRCASSSACANESAMISRSACASSATSASAAATRCSTRRPSPCDGARSAGRRLRLALGGRKIRRRAPHRRRAALSVHGLLGRSLHAEQRVSRRREPLHRRSRHARAARRRARRRPSSPSEKSARASSRSPCIERGQGDLVGMARALLADPDIPRKWSEGREDTVVRCVYGNVCKALDENFKRVVCTLWPKKLGAAPDSNDTVAPRVARRWRSGHRRSRATDASSCAGTPRPTTKRCTDTSSCAPKFHAKTPRKPREYCCIMQAFAPGRFATRTRA